MERANGLSKQQKSILRCVLQSMKTLSGGDRKAEEILLWIGVDWRPQIDDGSRRASLCRALKRLEKRGLIERLCGPKQRRTTAVTLTDFGLRVAEGLMVNTKVSNTSLEF